MDCDWLSSVRIITQRLLKQGVNVDFADELGQTPLYFASRAGHAKVVEALLMAGMLMRQYCSNCRRWPFRIF